MEQKDFDIYEILKGKTEGTSLYTPMCGKVEFRYLQGNKEAVEAIITNTNNGAEYTFDKNGKYLEEGEVLLFPSDKMRDWSKFAWKKGDVLVSEDGSVHIIFEKFTDDTYTIFAGKYYYSKDGKKAYSYFRECENVITEEFTLETEDAAKTYISTIEKRLGGKLNLETLEIEKQNEFKDGDIVIQCVLKGVNVCIIKNCIDKIDNKYNYYARYNTQDKEINYDDWSYISPFAKFATDSEKQQLFDALAKEGKRWDAENKMVVDLKPKVEFKPFDKVLVRNTDTEEWFPGFFEKFDSTWNYPYHIMNRRSMTDFAFKQCIPYEGNEHLAFTSDPF